MAARSQTTYYPSTATPGQTPETTPFCETCNSDESVKCCTSTSSYNGADETHDCDAVCNSCQNACDTVQNYCGTAINKQTIIQHADTHNYPSYCEAKDEFIFKNWTAERWNTIISNLQTAFILGWTQNHGSAPAMTDAVADPENSPHPANSLVTAKMYNEIAEAINKFMNTSLAKVKGVADDGIGDVIRGSHAVLQHQNYDKAKFNTTVCDICNTAAQFTSCPCACDCTCACSCSCGCSCPCNCNCSCSCTCACSSS